MTADPNARPVLPEDLAHRLDRLCDLFEGAWRAGRRPCLEDLLEGAAEPLRTALLRELLALELTYRFRVGEIPAVAEYLARFPEQAHLIQEVFDEFTLPIKAAQGSIHRLARNDWYAATPSLEPELRDPADYEGREQLLTTGKRLGGYFLLERIGRGGMGDVYKARQLGAERTVALKIIRPDQLAELGPEKAKQWINRFRSEAQAASQLEHANIVPVYEVGASDDCLFYSMRWIDGPSLAEVLRRGPLPQRVAAAYVEQVARAIDYAHRHGILHRDIKPANILLQRPDHPYPQPSQSIKNERILNDKSGQTRNIPPDISGPSGTPILPWLAIPLITDFGLAKWLGDTQGLTREGDCLGSPPYMSPEQIRDAAKVGPASDVYSLGATLYELITGRPPFQAASAIETLDQVLNQDPVPPRRLNAALDRDLETIILVCLNKNPKDRYASAAELADDLRRYSNREPIRRRPLGPIGRTLRWVQRNPLPATLSAVVILLLFATLIATTVGYMTTALAQHETRQNLRTALLREAVAHRLSNEAGRRWRALEALAQAAAIRPGPDLRDEYLRCLDLPDLRPLGGAVFPDDGDSTTTLLHFGHKPLPLLSGAGLLILDHANGQLAGPIKLAATLSSRSAISPNGRFLATGVAGRTGLLVWDLHEQSEPHRLLNPDGQPLLPHCLAFSDTSERLAVACEAPSQPPTGRCYALVVFDLTQQPPAIASRWQWDGLGLDCLRFHPNGELLAAGTSSTDHKLYAVRLWHVRTGQPARELPLESWGAWRHDLVVPGRLAFSQDGRYLAAARKNVRLWDIVQTRPQLLFQRTLESHPATCIQVAPDGKWLVTLDAGDRLSLWDVFHNTMAVCSQGPIAAPPWTSATDKPLLISRMGTDLKVWEIAQPLGQSYPFISQNLAATRNLDADRVALVFSPDERYLACGLDEPASPYLIDLLRPDDPVRSLRHGGGPHQLVFSSDGRRLWSVTGTGRQYLHHLADGTAENVSELMLAAAGYNAAEQRLGVRQEMISTLTLLNLTTGQVASLIHEEPGSADRLSPPLFSADGRQLLAALHPGGKQPLRIMVWEVATSKPTCERTHDPADETGRLFFENGRPRSLAFPDTLTVRDLLEDRLVPSDPPSGSPPFRNHGVPARFTFAANGRVCAETGMQGEIAVWDLSTPRRSLRCTLTRSSGRPSSRYGQDLKALSPDGSRLAAWDDSVLKVWDTSTGRLLDRLVFESRPELFAFTKDGTEVLIVQLGVQVSRWRVGAGHGEVLCSLEFDDRLRQEADRWWQDQHLQIEDAVGMSADGQRLVFASAPDAKGQTTVYSWQLPSGKLQTWQLALRTDRWPRLGVSPDGATAALLTTASQVVIRNLDTQAELASWPRLATSNAQRGPAPPRLARTLRFSSDGSVVAFLADNCESGTVRVVDLATGRERWTCQPEGPVTCLALSERARWLAVAADKLVSLYDSGQPNASAKKLTVAGVADLAFDRAGGLLALASEQTGHVSLWDTIAGKRLATITTGTEGVLRVAISPSGKKLASLDQKGIVRVWDLDAVHKQLANVGLEW